MEALFPALFLLGVWLCLLAHEMGHWFVARVLGLEVTKVQIGALLPVATLRLGTTEYVFKLLPFWGHIECPKLYSKTVSPRMRLGIFAAGPFASLVTALLCLAIADMAALPLKQAYPAVAENTKTLLKGERIIAINDEPLSSWKLAKLQLLNERAKDVKITTWMDNKTRSLSIDSRDLRQTRFERAPKDGLIWPGSGAEIVGYYWELLRFTHNNLFNRAMWIELGGSRGWTALLWPKPASSLHELGLALCAFNLIMAFLNLLPLPVFDGFHLFVNAGMRLRERVKRPVGA